jgi:hypothetical protein
MNKLNSKEKKQLLKILNERFGIEEDIFKDHQLYSTTKERIYLGPSYIPNELKIVSAGMLIFRENKPTTNFFQLFGKYIKKNIVEINKEQALDFIEGKDIEYEGLNQDYILVKYRDYYLGCGLLKENKIKNLVPKVKRLEIFYI